MAHKAHNPCWGAQDDRVDRAIGEDESLKAASRIAAAESEAGGLLAESDPDFVLVPRTNMFAARGRTNSGI